MKHLPIITIMLLTFALLTGCGEDSKQAAKEAAKEAAKSTGKLVGAVVNYPPPIKAGGLLVLPSQVILAD